MDRDWYHGWGILPFLFNFLGVAVWRWWWRSEWLWYYRSIVSNLIKRCSGGAAGQAIDGRPRLGLVVVVFYHCLPPKRIQIQLIHEMQRRFWSCWKSQVFFVNVTDNVRTYIDRCQLRQIFFSFPILFLDIMMCVCVLPFVECPLVLSDQLGQGEGPIGIVGPISRPRGTIDTASLMLDHTYAFECPFSEPTLLQAAKGVLCPHVEGIVTHQAKMYE